LTGTQGVCGLCGCVVVVVVTGVRSKLECVCVCAETVGHT